jgi:hypothetical protein
LKRLTIPELLLALGRPRAVIGIGHILKRTAPAQQQQQEDAGSRASRLRTAQSLNICVDCVSEFAEIEI